MLIAQLIRHDELTSVPLCLCGSPRSPLPAHVSTHYTLRNALFVRLI
jgi:hypothetical protein